MKSRGTTLLATGLALLGFAANTLLCRAALGGTIDAWSFTAARLCRRGRAVGPRASERSAQPCRRRELDLGLRALRLRRGLLARVPAPQRRHRRARALRSRASDDDRLEHSGGRSTNARRVGRTRDRARRARVAQVAGRARSRSDRAAVDGARGSRVGRVLVARAQELRATRDDRGQLARAACLSLGGLLVGWTHAAVSARGVWLAATSGALASGLAYSLWYLALPALGATRAALCSSSPCSPPRVGSCSSASTSTRGSRSRAR